MSTLPKPSAIDLNHTNANHSFINPTRLLKVTLILSFALFPKESNWRYPLGAFLVFGGLTVASLDQQRNKRNKTKNIESIGNGAPNGEMHGFNNLIPNLPMNGDQHQSEVLLTYDNGERRTSECRPLIKDVEIGRSSVANNTNSNGPERRRQ